MQWQLIIHPLSLDIVRANTSSKTRLFVHICDKLTLKNAIGLSILAGISISPTLTKNIVQFPISGSTLDSSPFAQAHRYSFNHPFASFF